MSTEVKVGSIVRLNETKHPEWKGMLLRMTSLKNEYHHLTGEVIKASPLQPGYRAGVMGFTMLEGSVEVVEPPSPFESSIRDYLARELS